MSLQTLQMGIKHFSGLFVMLCVGVALSLLTTIAEHIVYKLVIPRVKEPRFKYWLHTSQVLSSHTNTPIYNTAKHPLNCELRDILRYYDYLLTCTVSESNYNSMLNYFIASMSVGSKSLHFISTMCAVHIYVDNDTFCCCYCCSFSLSHTHMQNTQPFKFPTNNRIFREKLEKWFTPSMWKLMCRLCFQRLHRALNSVFTDDKLPTVTKPEKRYFPCHWSLGSIQFQFKLINPLDKCITVIYSCLI